LESGNILGIFGKLLVSQFNRVYFIIFRPMVWKLLIVEPFFQWKLNKIETEIYIKIWGHSWWCWKALDESDLIEFISQFSELRCGGYWFLSEFCCWKFKQIAKIGFGRKNQLSPQCVHTWTNGIGYTSEDETEPFVLNQISSKLFFVRMT
jgi:hypothetical protein